MRLYFYLRSKIKHWVNRYQLGFPLCHQAIVEELNNTSFLYGYIKYCNLITVEILLNALALLGVTEKDFCNLN